MHASAKGEGDPAAVSTTVWRIIGYTRWPVEEPPMQICIVGDSPNTDALHKAAELSSPKREGINVREWSANEASTTTCNVMYVGEITVEERTQLFQRITGRPILTVGEGAEFCSSGGMFCINEHNGSLRFEANLDAIGRSKLRINPQVLRLARQPNNNGHE